MSLSIPITPNSLSSAASSSGGPILARSLSLTTKLSQLSLTIPISKTYKTTPIRMGGLPRPREAQGMGGGPRPYPGGELLLEWKSMQGKKSKEVLKSRFDRERRLYKKRKRAEIKAAVSELERPWETLEKPPNLIRPDNGRPSQKGDIHSVKSDRKLDELTNQFEEFESSRSNQSGYIGRNVNNIHSVKSYRKMDELTNQFEEFGSSWSNRSGYNGRNVKNLERGASNAVENRNLKGKPWKNGNASDSRGKNLGNLRFSNKFDARSRRAGDSSREFRKSNGYKKEVLDMGLHNDGSYGFESGNADDAANSAYLGR